jgi:hypothetical protein
LAQKGVLLPIHLVSCVMIGKLAVMAIVAVWCSAAEAQSPPWKQTDVFPPSEGAMARALADPLIPLETKEQLFALFERRLWPQEIRDDEGRMWIYRRDAAPVPRIEGAQIAPRASEQDVSKLASGVGGGLFNPANSKALAGKR